MDFYEVMHQHPLFIHEIASFLVLSYANTLFDTLRPVMQVSGFGGQV